MRKHLILIFALLLLMGSVSHSSKIMNNSSNRPCKRLVGDFNSDVLHSHRAHREWTFMVYMDGDNNLESAAIDDFLEMSQIGSTSEVAIVVLFDRWSNASDPYDDTSYGNWATAKIFYVDMGEEPYAYNADDDWGEVNMGDPNTLYSFINYSIQNYPANKYALVLWDHGGGLFGACWDEDNGGDNLALYEIRSALQWIYEDLGVIIDVIGFDACLMSTIEALYYCKDYSRYFVASQEYEPGDGWPYDSILQYLTTNPTIGPDALAEKIVDYYIGYYSGIEENATMAAINVSSFIMDTYARINRLVGYLLRYYTTYQAAISYAISNAETFYYEWQKDLKHFLILLRSSVSDSELITLINETIRFLNISIISYEHLSLHPNAYGISAYFPEVIILNYEYLLSSEHHQWDEFTAKVAGNNVDIWFFDMEFYGTDHDGDGAYGVNLSIMIDLDTDTTNNVYLKVHGYDGEEESLLGQTSSFAISGASSSDAINVSISVPSKSIYVMRIEVYNSSGLIKQFYYYCDPNISGVYLEPYDLEYDTIPPTVVVEEPENNSYINKNQVTIYWTYSDNDGVDHIEIKIDSSAWNPIGLSNNYTTPYLGEGEHHIYVKAVDISGNEYVYHLVVIVDTTKPYVSITQPANYSYIGSSEVYVAWEAYDENMDHFDIYVDGSLRYTKTTTYCTISGLSDGTHMIEVEAIDKAGNKNSSLIFIIVDTQPPSIEVISPTNGSTTNTMIITLELDITDNLGVSYVEIYVNGSLYVNTTENYDSIQIKFSKTGQYNITIKAVDIVGNSDSIRLYISVEQPTQTTEHTLETSPNIVEVIMPFIIILSLIIIAVVIWVSRRRAL